LFEERYAAQGRSEEWILAKWKTKLADNTVPRKKVDDQILVGKFLGTHDSVLRSTQTCRFNFYMFIGSQVAHLARQLVHVWFQLAHAHHACQLGWSSQALYMFIVLGVCIMMAMMLRPVLPLHPSSLLKASAISLF
jgi:hypothetical protein